MAKKAHCENCSKAEELTNLGNVPDDWFTLRRGSEFADEQHLCGLACLRSAVEKRLIAAGMPAPRL